MAKKLVALFLSMLMLIAFGGQIAFADGDKDAQPMGGLICPACSYGYMLPNTVYTAYLPVTPMQLRDCTHGYANEVDIYYYRKVGSNTRCSECGYSTTPVWTSTQYKWVCQH